ncbi:MAG TPA: aminotransferase class IV, partial [Mariprofundaceae bacterium]|nr:aminotransferase class IV [Mariprofundaceae bacterium]
LDRGLAYGEGCFETFRVIDGEVFLWHRHMERLRRGLACFGYSMSEMDADLIRKKAVHEANGHDTLIRVTVTGGEASWGLIRPEDAKPAVYIQALSYQQNEQLIELASVEWPFPVSPKHAKFTSDYALALRAMHQWQLAPTKTPLVCKDGRVLSSLTANVLILHDGQWYTPDDAAGGVLPGVVRSLLLEKGLVESTACPVEWLEHCEALMLSNSALFAKSVSWINGREIDSMHSAAAAVRELLRMFPGVKY